jgi:hypothetical protein
MYHSVLAVLRSSEGMGGRATECSGVEGVAGDLVVGLKLSKTIFCVVPDNSIVGDHT